MIDVELFQGEPIGMPQEEYGAEVVDTCTHTALDQFIETMNASMAPLLNVPGLAMLYVPGAFVEIGFPGCDGRQHERVLHGLPEIEAFFESLSKVLISIEHVEADRCVRGRLALWSGTVHAVEAVSRDRIQLNALHRLEFDEADRVVRQRSRLLPRRRR